MYNQWLSLICHYLLVINAPNISIENLEIWLNIIYELKKLYFVKHEPNYSFTNFINNIAKYDALCALGQSGCKEFFDIFLLTCVHIFCTIFTLLHLFPNTSPFHWYYPSSLGRTCFSFLFSDFVEEKKRKDKMKNVTF
jgi:hypothetical protein